MSNPSNDDAISITASDMVGMIQRMLFDTNGYLSQPIDQINPAVVHGLLVRCLEMNRSLATPPSQGNGRDAEATAAVN